MNIIQMAKAYTGMIMGKTDYWHPDMNMNNSLNPECVAKYPVDMSAKAEYAGAFDEDQIPLVEIDGHLSHLSVTIAQYALGNYDEYIRTQNYKYLKRFLGAADWLVTNLVEYRSGQWGWINDHDKMVYNLKKPWLSALSQGQALSVLVRAYQETKDELYRDTGQKALRAFNVPVAEGGMLAKWQGLDYFEEYPAETPTFVLNGFIFALWGLWEFYLVTKSTEAKAYYESGLKTLEHSLKDYQIPYLNWSRYDLYPFKVTDIASIFYHKLHIQQLRAMALLTGNEMFNQQAEIWEKARNSSVRYVLATGYKIVHKLSISKQSSYVPSVKKG